MPINKLLTDQQAYLAMYAFLYAYWERGQSEEIANLLSCMSLLPDGCTADPAYISDWKDAVEKVLSGKVDAALHFRTA